jgi:hypothetical protein
MAFVLAGPNTKHGGFHFSQVLTTAVVLVMVCPHEIYVLQVLSGRGVAALNATRSVLHSERVLE